VVDEVERLIDKERLDDVDVHMDEAVAAQVSDVRERACLQVVDTDHAVAAGEQLVADVGAEEASAAGN